MLDRIIEWHKRKAVKTVNQRKRDMHKRYAEYLESVKARLGTPQND